MAKQSALIITSDTADNSKIEKALIANGIDEISTCYDFDSTEKNLGATIALVDYELASLELYTEIQGSNAQLFIPVLIINPPKSVSVDERNQLLQDGYADILSGTIATINSRLLYFIHEAERATKYQSTSIDSTSLKKHMDSELEVAISMFDKLYAKSCFDSKNIKSNFSSERLFNGDLILAARKPDNDLIIFIGDFTSHGLPMAIGAIPASETFFGMSKKGFSFESILNEVNRKLKNILPLEIYCAAALLEINLNKQVCKLWNGGLPELILTNESGEIKKQFSANHPPLAILNEHEFNADSLIFEFETTDKLFSFSGGVIKACNHLGEQYDHHLEACFQNKIDAHSLYEYIQSDIKAFATKDAFDEATILELSFNTEEAPLKTAETKQKHALKNLDWKLDLSLPPDSLRNFDPLPVLLHILMEQPALDSHRSQIYAILAELFSNALDHGILGLDSKQKSDINGFSEYYQARTDKLAALSSAEVKIRLNNIPDEEGGRLIIVIEDTGPGFDYKKKNQSFDENKGYCGRGMAMIYDMCELVEYSGRGNVVKVIYRWS